MGSLEDVKEYLKSTTNSKGVDLYRHLTEVFNKLLREKPATAYQDFEIFSAFVKKYSFNYNEPRDSAAVNSIAQRRTEMSQWVTDCKAMIEVPRAYNEEGLLVEQKTGPIAYVPDLLADWKVLKWAGVNFGD
jgi:hypothetical protein